MLPLAGNASLTTCVQNEGGFQHDDLQVISIIGNWMALDRKMLWHIQQTYPVFRVSVFPKKFKNLALVPFPK